MKNIYLIIPNNSVGGTQKRLITVWNYAHSVGQYPIYLVINENLFTLLSSGNTFSKLYRNNRYLIIIRASRFLKMIPKLIVLALKAGPGALFHYPLTSIQFIHTLLFQKVIRSIPMPDLTLLFYKSIRLYMYYVLFRSYKIDVLNERVIQQIKSHWLLKRISNDRIFHTRGNSIKIPDNIDISDKKNWIVFLGRFTDQGGDLKNVFSYTKLLPSLYAYLSENGITNLRFYILGYGPLETSLKVLLNQPDYSSIPVQCYFEPEPQNVLKYSKVFLSLQKYSNYPSRSLLEAMSYGNLPIITDVGESRQMAKETFAEFIPIDYDYKILGGAIMKLLNLDKIDFNNRVTKAHDHIREHFSIDVHLKYFLGLYGFPRHIGI